MHPVIALALVMVAGIAATRLPRFPSIPAPFDVLTLAGTHLLLLGLLLGPFGEVLDDATLQVLSPVTALGLGWVGARLGARFEWRWVRRLPPRVWALAGTQAVAAFVAVALVSALLIKAIPALRATWPSHRWTTVLALGAMAAASAPDLITLLARRLGAAPRLIRTLRAAGVLDAAFGVLAFSLVLGGRRYGIAGGLPVGLVAGGIVGALFFALARLVLAADDMTAPLMGAILLGAGAGYAAGVSSVLVCAVAVASAGPFLERRRQLARRLDSWERSVVAVLLLLTGALLRLPTMWVLALGVLVTAARIAARWAGVRFGQRVWRGLAPPAPDAGLGGVAQGGVVVALAVGWQLSRPGPATAAALAAVVLGVTLSQLAAGPCMARAVRPREL